MPRLLALALLLVIGGPALGVFELVGSACQEDCRDDGRGGPCCPSTCASCVCAARAPTVLPGAVASLPMPELRLLAKTLLVLSTPTDPDPTEILHVPRPLA